MEKVLHKISFVASCRCIQHCSWQYGLMDPICHHISFKGSGVWTWTSSIRWSWKVGHSFWTWSLNFWEIFFGKLVFGHYPLNDAWSIVLKSLELGKGHLSSKVYSFMQYACNRSTFLLKWGLLARLAFISSIRHDSSLSFPQTMSITSFKIDWLDQSGQFESRIGH